MKQGQNIQNIYGYLVCLISIIIILITLPNLLESTVDLIKPDYSERRPSILDQSIESWKENKQYKYCLTNNEINLENCNYPADDVLISLLAEEKANSEARFIQVTFLLLIQRAFLITFTTILFILHWNWLKNINKEK